MRRSMTALLAGILLSSAATAEDWSGFYAGVYGGYAAGDSTNQWSNYNTPWTPDGDIAFDGFVGGGLAGYQLQLDGLVVGAEADLGLASLIGDDDTNQGRLNQIEIGGLATVRARLGVTFDNMMLFGTGGIAAASFTKSDIGPTVASLPDDPQLAAGWVVGFGAEMALDADWRPRAEVQHIGLADVETALAFEESVGYRHRAQEVGIDIVRAGISRGF